MSGRLALRDAIDAHAHRAIDKRQAIYRGNITKLMPLTVDVFGFGIPLTLDDDFEMSQWMALYQSAVGLQLDDQVFMHQEGHDWVMVDVVSDKAIPDKLGVPTPNWKRLPLVTGVGGNWSDVGKGTISPTVGTVVTEPSVYRVDGTMVQVRAMIKNGNAVSYPSLNVTVAILPIYIGYAKVFVGAMLDSASHYIAPVMIAQEDGRIQLVGGDVGQVPLGNNGSYQWLAFQTDLRMRT